MKTVKIKWNSEVKSYVGLIDYSETNYNIVNEVLEYLMENELHYMFPLFEDDVLLILYKDFYNFPKDILEKVYKTKGIDWVEYLEIPYEHSAYSRRLQYREIFHSDYATNNTKSSYVIQFYGGIMLIDNRYLRFGKESIIDLHTAALANSSNDKLAEIFIPQAFMLGISRGLLYNKVENASEYYSGNELVMEFEEKRE